jgi:hypothetical protein
MHFHALNLARRGDLMFNRPMDSHFAPHRGKADTSAEREHVAGTYRPRVTLASARFDMIDDGLRFQLVPWRPEACQHVSGTLAPGGAVDWSFARKRGLGV